MIHRGKLWNKEVVKSEFFFFIVLKINMDPTGVVRRVINRPRDVIPRNPAMNPDVKNYLLNYIIPLYLVFS
jgi:hypothetical protein